MSNNVKRSRQKHSERIETRGQQIDLTCQVGSPSCSVCKQYSVQSQHRPCHKRVGSVDWYNLTLHHPPIHHQDMETPPDYLRGNALRQPYAVLRPNRDLLEHSETCLRRTPTLAP